ncbi:MAG TPA: hypothetical protein VFB52_01485 [Solirubrobacterales bacterium]|nr:hypothetical protein [Solirubrobacterales bacterium]
MSKMTVDWDRGEQIGFMPEASEVVYPEPILTVEWVPLTTATIIDYDPADLLVTPGAGPDVPPGGGPGEGGGPGGGDGPGAPTHYGRPQLVVPKRRSEKSFLEHGLRIGIDAPAPARVRAVLKGKLPRTKTQPSRWLNLTKVVTQDTGAGEGALVLDPSRAGRRALHRLEDSVRAELILVVRYANGQDPIRIERGLTIVDS